MKKDDYQPFGKEWKKEMQKLPKDVIIDMLAKANAYSNRCDDRLFVGQMGL